MQIMVLSGYERDYGFYRDAESRRLAMGAAGVKSETQVSTRSGIVVIPNWMSMISHLFNIRLMM